ncbi:MAG: nuclear transport factor 2 family protein [Tannerella sp.]|nr:nuclear transport factor 2 family protein [Tannerella sp.]
MKKKKMNDKRITGYILLFMLAVCISIPAKAQYETVVNLIDGAPNNQIKAALEKNGGLLLTELNNAQGAGRKLSLGEINMDGNAVTSLNTMWEICPFRCDELEIVERCLKTHSGGFQIRNIPVIMEPRKGERFDNDKYQEIVLNFDASGKIIGLCIALSNTMYVQLMNGGGPEVTDFRERAMVVDFVEQFRTAYNRKDIKYLQDIYSDDALIITGKVERVAAANKDNIQFKNQGNVTYTSQTKKEYLERLANVFKNNDRINVVFENIKINKHSKKKVYGVKLVQHWNSGSYSDVGYLFLLWDFSDENKPMIHVRTWQPYKETRKEDVFDISDFDTSKIKDENQL